MEIKGVKIADLVPYRNNARTHSPEQISRVADSIREFGFCNPVLVDSENGIIAGHGRVMAAEELGMDEVPTVCLEHLSDDQKRAYILADNKLALDAGWDKDLLKLELLDLQEDDFNISLTGFSEFELQGLLELDTEPEKDKEQEKTGQKTCPECGAEL